MSIRSSHCRVGQISDKRAMVEIPRCCTAIRLRAVGFSTAQGRNEFRILRIKFDTSGKTVALCHRGPFESGTNQSQCATRGGDAFRKSKGRFQRQSSPITEISVSHLRAAVQSMGVTVFSSSFYAIWKKRINPREFQELAECPGRH
jgi:hypothetical protein